MDELKKLKCDLCGDDVFVLIQIQCATDVAFSPHKGVCYNCFKKGELDERVFMKTKEFINEQIKSAKEREEFWGTELKKLPEESPAKI